MTDRQAEYAETVERLDQKDPHWRSGDPTTDGMVVILATGIRQVLDAIFNPRPR